MLRQVQISVDRIDGTRLNMSATLANDEVLLLESYLECADQLLLLNVARDGVPCSFEMKIRDGRVECINSEIPPAGEIAALLHRLRPFILAEEPTSYVKISALLAKQFEYPYLRQVLKGQRRLFDCRNNQELLSITSNGTVVNCEQTLFDWLNGYEYHRDPAKRERITSLHRLMPLEHSMPILVGMLGDKVQAIFQLAALIAVILGREHSVQIVRHGRSPELPSSTVSAEF